VSPSSPVVLASGQLNRAGDTLTVELHQPANSPSFVMVVWPAKPSVTQPTPKALAALAGCNGPVSGGGANGNSPRKSGTAADRCRRAARCMKRCTGG
jgi:hypothetical protein